MSAIDTAILLAAGEGSRLRQLAPSKPLCRVGGMTLLDHALARLAIAGISRVIVVLGYKAADVETDLARSSQPLEILTVTSPDWRLPNGVSALAAHEALDREAALLAMCDHLVDPELYARIRQHGAGPGLRLGVDSRLSHPWIDLDDVTRVFADGARIKRIGKGIAQYNSYDTGVFAVGPRFFQTLEQCENPSISEAVQQLAEFGHAETVDCSDLDWIDIDDPRALALAEQWISGSIAA